MPPRYSASELTDMILLYGECRGNGALASRIYRERYGNTRVCPPNGTTVIRAVLRVRDNRPLVPYLDNTERSEKLSSVGFLAEDEDEVYTEQTKIVIAKVYHYFEQEYEELKKAYKSLDLTPLSKFSHRTALATGVSETTVLEILQWEERRNTEEKHVQLRVRRKAPKRSRDTDSSSEEDCLESNDDSGEESRTDLKSETLVVKEEPLETDNEEPEVYVQRVGEPGVSGANEVLPDPLIADVKLEPQNEEENKVLPDPLIADVKLEPQNAEENNSNDTRTVQPASKRYKRRTRGRHADAEPLGTSGPLGVLTHPAHLSHPPHIKELLLLEHGEVKVEDVEIGEEGFS